MGRSVSFGALFSVLVLLFSCSDNSPQLSSVVTSVVFDYTEENSLPFARMAVLACVESDARYASEIRVSSPASGLTWVEENPMKFRDVSGREWVGSLSLRIYDDVFPEGKYVFTYEDKAECETSVDFSVEYDGEWFSRTASESLEILEKNGNMFRKVAVYSTEGDLLYFDVQKASWTTDDDILTEFKSAGSKRICWCSAGNATVCMMPAVYFENKNF